MATVISGLGTVTALVNVVCSCCGCNYHSWKGICVNCIISLMIDRHINQVLLSDVATLYWDDW